jgi:hypothetical protein
MAEATAASKAKRAASTAEDTLKRKSADPNIISGGHLVAKALKAEGVDTTSATSRPPRTPPTATRGRPGGSAVW